LPLIATIRDRSPLFALFVLFAIRYSGLFAVRYSRLFAIRVFQTPHKAGIFFDRPASVIFSYKISDAYIANAADGTLPGHANVFVVAVVLSGAIFLAKIKQTQVFGPKVL